MQIEVYASNHYLLAAPSVNFADTYICAYLK